MKYIKRTIVSILQQVRCVNICLASMSCNFKFITVLGLLIKLCLEFTIVLLTLLSHIGLICGPCDVALGSEMLLSSLILQRGEMQSLVIESPISTVNIIKYLLVLSGIELLFLLLFLHLLKKPLPLLLLLAALAFLLCDILTVEVCAPTDVRSLTWVLIIDGLSCSLHIFILYLNFI